MSVEIIQIERKFITDEVPVGTMIGDGDVRGSTIDEVVTVGVDGIVGTLCEIHDSCW